MSHLSNLFMTIIITFIHTIAKLIFQTICFCLLNVGYLTEREADGVNVINWYHRQFIDVCKERYFRNLNFLNEIHSNISEYFMGR